MIEHIVIGVVVGVMINIFIFIILFLIISSISELKHELYELHHKLSDMNMKIYSFKELSETKRNLEERRLEDIYDEIRRIR